jgi:hypothetical protein
MHTMSDYMLNHCKQLEGATIRKVVAVKPDPDEYIDEDWIRFIIQLENGDTVMMIPSQDEEMNGPGYLYIETILRKKGGTP